MSKDCCSAETASTHRRRRGISQFQIGRLRLDVRNAVVVRRVAHVAQTLFYLSLFDDEIDSRVEALLSLGPLAPWSEAELVSVALNLEPTDAVVIAGEEGDILAARGGASSFPLYWAKTGGAITVSTVLPVDRERCLSRAGLLHSVAVVSMTYQNEPNLTLQSPLSGWFRCRRGAVTRLSPAAGCVCEHPIDHAEPDGGALDRCQLISAIGAALDGFGQRLGGSRKAVVELSGGVDSTLAAIAAGRHGFELRGVSVRYPYYEFRFEEHIQQATADVLAGSRVLLDGESILPYAPPDYWPRLDEPATSVISFKRDLAIARIAAAEGIDRVLVGQGGDQLFAEDMLSPLPPPSSLTRQLFSTGAWTIVERARVLMQATSVFRRRSTLAYLYDARLDIPMKESLGTMTRSPFTDLAVIRCGLSWAALSARLGRHEGKRILTEAFAAELPSAVANRRGKVCWDGVCARAYAHHGGAILHEIEQARGPLEHLGIEVSWLMRRVGSLARWEQTRFGHDDREVFAVYALATWLRAWGVERVSDCRWSN